MKVSNYSIFICTVIILVVLVITATTIRLSENHEEKLIYAMQSKVEYYAKRCYLEEKCKGEVTLQTLYDNNYITEVIDPVTKEIISHDLKINYNDNKIIINW